MKRVKVVYTVTGFLAPFTDTVGVPDNYTDADIKEALNVLLDECGHTGAKVRDITLVTEV